MNEPLTTGQMIQEMEAAGYIVVVDQTSAGLHRVRVSRHVPRFRQQTTATSGAETAIRSAYHKWRRALTEGGR